MARIICAAPPLVGHLTPLAALAGMLRERGHEVVVIDYFPKPFCVPEGVQHVSIPSFGIERAVSVTGRGNVVSESINALRNFCLDVFQETLRHCADFKPDLLVFDQLLPIAPMIARELQCSYLYTISSPLEFFHKDPSAFPLNKGMAQAFNGIFGEMCANLSQKLGSKAAADTCSPGRYLCFATELFCGVSSAESPFATSSSGTTGGVPVSFIGPAFLQRKPSAEDRAMAAQLAGFGGKRFFVSLGSVIAGMAPNRESAVKIFRNTLLSHNEQNCLFLFSAPEALLREAFEGLRINATVIARPFVNQFYLMDRFSLVFSHGGYNPAAESLFYGVPTIAFPFLFDQGWIAQRLEELGVGVRISRVRHTPLMLRDHADRLLTAADVRSGLTALQADAHRINGRLRGAEAIEAVLASSEEVVRE